MLCPNCQKEILEETLKCPFCDADLSAANGQEVVAEGKNEETTVSETVAEQVAEETVLETCPAEETVAKADESKAAPLAEPTAEPKVEEPKEVPPTFVSSEEFFKKYDLFDPDRKQEPIKPAEAPAKAKKKLNWILVLIALLILIGVLATVFVIKNRDTSDDTAESSESSTESVSDEVIESVTSSDDETTSEEGDSSSVPDKFNAEALAGDWGFELSFTEMSTTLDGSLPFETDAVYKLYLRFNADNTVQLISAPEDYKATMKVYLEDYFAYLRNGGYYELREQEGYSKEQTDAMLAESGMTVDLLLDNLQEEMQNKDALEEATLTDDGYVLLSDTETVTTYTLETNKILFVTDEDLTRETYISFLYADGVMTVTEGTYAKGVLVEKSLTKK